jgi:hypothetical protein
MVAQQTGIFHLVPLEESRKETQEFNTFRNGKVSGIRLE